jgi:hypothetical protein
MIQQRYQNQWYMAKDTTESCFNSFLDNVVINLHVLLIIFVRLKHRFVHVSSRFFYFSLCILFCCKLVIICSNLLVLVNIYIPIGWWVITGNYMMFLTCFYDHFMCFLLVCVLPKQETWSHHTTMERHCATMQCSETSYSTRKFSFRDRFSNRNISVAKLVSKREFSSSVQCLTTLHRGTMPFHRGMMGSGFLLRKHADLISR